MADNHFAHQEECKGCQEMKQTVNLVRRLGDAAAEYLSILDEISTDVESLLAELPDVINPVQEILLPQGLKNNIKDPRAIIKQFTNLCRTWFSNALAQQTETKNEELNKDVAVQTEDIIEVLQKEVDENSKTIESLQSDLNTIRTDNEELLTEKETQAKMIEDLKAEKERDLESHHQKITELERQFQEEKDTNAAKVSEVEELTKEQERLCTQKAQCEEEITALKAGAIAKESSLCTARGEVKVLEEIKQKLNGTIREKSGSLARWIENYAQFSCVIPQSAHDDDRITPIMSQFMQRVNSQMNGCSVNVIPKPGPDIDISVGLPVILPCVAASRIGSDISAAFTKAQIASGQVILVIFHHLAPHNSKINTPTEQRLSDRTLLDQCVGMVDAVFWNGAMYDCDSNHAAVRKIQRLFTWRFSMDNLNKLRLLAQFSTEDDADYKN